MNLGSVGLGSGTFSVTGSMEVYFADGSMYDKFLADTYTSLSVSTKDTLGNGYILTLPRVQLIKGTITAGGKDAELMATFDFEALADQANATASLRKTLFIDRVGVAVA
jgi:hypothetical protein